MSDRRIPSDRRVSDRRRSERVSLCRDVRFLSAVSPTTVLQGHLHDVSSSGIRLMLERPVSHGEKLLIEVRDAERTLCNVTVQVVWIEKTLVGHHDVGCISLPALSPRQMDQLKAAAVGTSSVAPNRDDE